MKRILFALLSAVCMYANAATLVPIQLLNPAGSTSGQAIVSTGASTAPAWSAINAATLNGATFASPGNIGTGTAGTGNFTLITGSAFFGPGAGFSITTSTGLSSGGGIQLFDGTHGSNVNITNAGNIVATFTSTGMNAAPIGVTTPSSGAFTSLSATGLITPASTIGIKGTTTNDSAQAGSWGELASAPTTGVSMTNNTAANCSSKSLTAGQWLVWGLVAFQPSAVPGQIVAGISTTSATLGAAGTYQSLASTGFTSGNAQSLMAPPQPLQLSTTTTVYLIGQMQFSSGTGTCNGYINAYRMR